MILIKSNLLAVLKYIIKRILNKKNKTMKIDIILLKFIALTISDVLI